MKEEKEDKEDEYEKEEMEKLEEEEEKEEPVIRLRPRKSLLFQQPSAFPSVAKATSGPVKTRNGAGTSPMERALEGSAVALARSTRGC